jgi:hypothetical protein
MGKGIGIVLVSHCVLVDTRERLITPYFHATVFVADESIPFHSGQRKMHFDKPFISHSHISQTMFSVSQTYVCRFLLNARWSFSHCL